jgi:hypothetical protein
MPLAVAALLAVDGEARAGGALINGNPRSGGSGTECGGAARGGNGAAGDAEVVVVVAFDDKEPTAFDELETERCTIGAGRAGAGRSGGNAVKSTVGADGTGAAEVSNGCDVGSTFTAFEVACTWGLGGEAPIAVVLLAGSSDFTIVSETGCVPVVVVTTGACTASVLGAVALVVLDTADDDEEEEDAEEEFAAVAF